MRESDVLLFPSVEEGSALVTYEAQASGCALLVSEETGARCTHLQEGLVHRARDVATLTEHVRLLSGDPELLARLRRGAVANSRNLTWDCAGRELATIYDRIVGERPVAVPRRK
jgi:glycosyltransferase involved in cell wall biosynthesis